MIKFIEKRKLAKEKDIVALKIKIENLQSEFIEITDIMIAKLSVFGSDAPSVADNRKEFRAKRKRLEDIKELIDIGNKRLEYLLLHAKPSILEQEVERMKKELMKKGLIK